MITFKLSLQPRSTEYTVQYCHILEQGTYLQAYYRPTRLNLPQNLENFTCFSQTASFYPKLNGVLFETNEGEGHDPHSGRDLSWDLRKIDEKSFRVSLTVSRIDITQLYYSSIINIITNVLKSKHESTPFNFNFNIAKRFCGWSRVPIHIADGGEGGSRGWPPKPSGWTKWDVRVFLDVHSGGFT